MHKHIEWDEPGSASVAALFKDDPEHTPPYPGAVLSARYQGRIVRVKVEAYREEDAVSIKEQLDAGADFAALAKESSTGPSGPNGGELGWFENGRMVPEFEAAVAEMRPGEVSDPVQTQFGWHIIKLNDRRKLEAPDYEDVREEIGLELAQQAVEDRINQLTASATIDRPEIENLEPSVLRDMSLIEN